MKKYNTLKLTAIISAAANASAWMWFGQTLINGQPTYRVVTTACLALGLLYLSTTRIETFYEYKIINKDVVE